MPCAANESLPFLYWVTLWGLQRDVGGEGGGALNDTRCTDQRTGTYVCFLHVLPLQSVDRPSKAPLRTRIHTCELTGPASPTRKVKLSACKRARKCCVDLLGDVDHGGSVGGGVGLLDFGVRSCAILSSPCFRRKRQAVAETRLKLRLSHPEAQRAPSAALTRAQRGSALSA